MLAATRIALFSFVGFATITGLVWWRFAELGDHWAGLSLALCILGVGLLVLNLHLTQVRSWYQHFESTGLMLREEIMRLKRENQSLVSAWKKERIQSEDTILWMKHLSDALLKVLSDSPKSTILQANYDELKALRERLDRELVVPENSEKIQRIFEEIDETLIKYFEKLYGSSPKVYELIWDSRQRFSMELPAATVTSATSTNVLPFRGGPSPFKAKSSQNDPHQS